MGEVSVIRKDQDRQQLRGLLLAGSASVPAAEADPAYFDGLRDKLSAAALACKARHSGLVVGGV